VTRRTTSRSESERLIQRLAKLRRQLVNLHAASLALPEGLPDHFDTAFEFRLDDDISVEASVNRTTTADCLERISASAGHCCS
jgi:hypothetical protein